MKSISFPKMFTSSSTLCTNDDVKSTRQNLELLLLSEKTEFKFDPYFGIRLKKYMFDQNNYILRDIIIDEVYTQISTFIPQVTINRSDITITQSGVDLYLKIVVTNKKDFTLNTYNIVLFEEENS